MSWSNLSILDTKVKQSNVKGLSNNLFVLIDHFISNHHGFSLLPYIELDLPPRRGLFSAFRLFYTFTHACILKMSCDCDESMLILLLIRSTVMKCLTFKIKSKLVLLSECSFQRHLHDTQFPVRQFNGRFKMPK